MGMYTQIRGWLNVVSSGTHTESRQVETALEAARQEYLAMLGNARPRVSEHAWVHRGGNGSVFVFIGTELKNYDASFDNWLKVLLKHLPTAEGRIDIQYEEEDWEDENSTSRVVLVRGGQVIEERREHPWTNGYGNGI